ncbi:hypothetical protein DDQ50_02835 [Amnibacterium flavum]|uniref:Uncharacterized protein n=2 Tax=Amnibacterium flavum TaxID=2173173 RepID=A0A2V1HWE9_9MICO|nr:hypothetical protein DDQ50_02835 [Amnibacterium flavum]
MAETAHLLERAGRIDAIADELADATHAVSRLADLEWNSAAASLFRSAIGSLVIDLDRARHSLRESADAYGRAARGA